MNALDFLKSENQSSKISAKSFLSGEVEVQPELTQPKKEFVQPSSSNPNLEALGKTLYNLPRNLVEVSDSIVSGATLGLSERAAQAGTWASKKLFGEIPGRQEQLQEADKDYEPTNKYVKGAAEFAGAVAPISVASKFLATPIKVAVSGIGKSKYIPPLANLIGWGVAGSAYDTTANLIKEGELPTAKEVAESGAMWMGFEGVLSAAGWTGKLALGVRRFAKDAGITSKEALNVILGEAKKTNAPIAKFASDWTKYQSQLKKMEGTPRGEELNLKINQAAEDFVNDVYVKANKVGKQGTYPDLIDSIIQKDKDIIASKKGTPLLKPDTTPVKSRIPEPLKGVQGEGDARPLWEIKQEVDSIERERYIDAIIENYKANQLLAEKGFKKAQRDLEKTRELFDLASKEKEKISKSRAEDIKVDEEFVPENIPMSEQSLRPDQKAKLSERLRPEEPVPSNELSAIEGADRRKIPVEDVKADAQRRDEISSL